MNIQQIIDAFGHSSESDIVDDILTKIQCKARPKGNDSVVTAYSAGKDLALEFSSIGSYRDHILEEPKSDGWYILRAVDVEQKYKGELPYGLLWTLDGNGVSQLLGKALEIDDDIQTHHVRNVLIVVRFKDGKRTKITSFGFSMRDKYDAKRFGI